MLLFSSRANGGIPPLWPEVPCRHLTFFPTWFLCRVLSNIRNRMVNAGARIVLIDYACVADERRHKRSLVSDAVAIWMNCRLIMSFRTLDEWALVKKWRRNQVQKTRKGILLRDVGKAFRGWLLVLNRGKAIKMMGFRIANRFARELLGDWRDYIVELSLSVQEELAKRSPGVMRWRQQPAKLAIQAWDESVKKTKRERLVVANLRWRMIWRCAIEAFDDWKVYVALCVEDRRVEMQQVMRLALEGGDLSSLGATLKGHFSRPYVREGYRSEDMREMAAEVIARQRVDAKKKSKGRGRGGGAAATAAASTGGGGLAGGGGGGGGGGGSGSRDAVVEYASLERRTHLRAKFAESMRRQVTVDSEGTLHRAEAQPTVLPPPHPSFTSPRRDDLFSMTGKIHKHIEGDAFVQRIKGAASPPTEKRAHAGMVRYHDYVIPPVEIRRMGLIREHADSMLSSSLPVPLGVYNVNSVEASMGSLYKLRGGDSMPGLPARIGAHSRGKGGAKRPHEQSVVEERKGSKLSAKDLSLKRTEVLDGATAKSVHDSISHFASVMAAPQRGNPALTSTGSSMGGGGGGGGVGGVGSPRDSRRVGSKTGGSAVGTSGTRGSSVAGVLLSSSLGGGMSRSMSIGRRSGSSMEVWDEARSIDHASASALSSYDHLPRSKSSLGHHSRHRGEVLREGGTALKRARARTSSKNAASTSQVEVARQWGRGDAVDVGEFAERAEHVLESIGVIRTLPELY